MTDTDTTPTAKWTDDSLLRSEASALFWGDSLGGYATQQRRRGERLAYGAALLSAVTGLAVWGTLSALDDWWAVAIVSVVALTSAMINVVSAQRRYGECAGSASQLVGRYQDARTAIRQARVALRDRAPNAEQLAAEAQAMFNTVKAAKDQLELFPQELQSERERREGELEGKVTI